MDSFPPYNKIEYPKSRMNSLLLILIFALFASGAALIVLRQINFYDREQIYLATQSTLPQHKISAAAVSNDSQTSTKHTEWRQVGQKIEVDSFNQVSFEIPKGWYWSDIRLEEDYPGTKVFNAVASNYPNSEKYNKGDHPEDFEWFMVSVLPAGNSYKNAGIQQYADKQEDFVLPNGSATLFEILKPKPGTEDMVLPVYSGVALGDQPGFGMEYEVAVTHGMDGFPRANSALKNAMITLLKSVHFEIKWATYRNLQKGFEFEYPEQLEAGKEQMSINLGTYQNSVMGTSIGQGTLVILNNQALKKEATGIIESIQKYVKNPPSEEEKQAGLYVECFNRNVINSNAVVIAGNCYGEGGPVYYGYIKGQDFDVFYDGIGRDMSPETADRLLSTFKFTK